MPEFTTWARAPSATALLRVLGGLEVEPRVGDAVVGGEVEEDGFVRHVCALMLGSAGLGSEYPRRRRKPSTGHDDGAGGPDL